MRSMWTRGAAVVCAVILWAGAADAQVSVSTVDVQRLQDTIYEVGSEVSRLRSRDATLADRLQIELDDLREEAIYLKVKMRKEGNVTRAEYADLRDRIESVRARARGTASTTSGARSGTASGTTSDATSDPYPPASAARPSASTSDDRDPYSPQPASRSSRRSAPNTVPVSQEIDVRLQTPLSSGTAQVEDRFEATTLVDLYQDDRVLIPAGSVMRGVVTAVDKATRTDRKGALTLSFDQITVRGRSYPIRASVTEAIESEGLKGEAARIGTGAGVGAVIGGILGGWKGALAGVLVGAGGTVIATEGKDVSLPAGTVLRVRFDSPLVLD